MRYRNNGNQNNRPKKTRKEIDKGVIKIPYKEKVEIGNIVLKTTDKKQLDEIHTLLTNKTRKVEISLELKLKCHQKPILKLNDGKNQIEVIGEQIVELAINTPISKDRIEEQITKFGSSIYQAKEVFLDIDDNIFISIKELNELRREAILKLNEKRIYNYPYQKGKYHREVPNFPVEKKKSVSISEEYQYKLVEKEDWDKIYVEKEELLNKLKGDARIMKKISRVMHHISLKKEFMLVGEFGSFYFYPHVCTDWSFNVTNSYTAAFLFSRGAKQVTLSYELEETRIKLLISAYKKRYHAHPNFELIIYGKEEVMISKFHLLKYFHVKSGYLKDRFHNLYPIEENKEVMKIYNYKPRNKKENYYQYGINSVRFQFVDEKESEMKKIINEL